MAAARGRRQWTAQAGLRERADAPEPGPGQVRCVQCRWPVAVADDACCCRCRVRYYATAAGIGRRPDRFGVEDYWR